MYKILLFFWFLGFTSLVSAQEKEHDHIHHESPNEIGLGLGMVKVMQEEGLGMGLHLHYRRSLGERQLFSLAPGIEKIFGEHPHTSFNIALGFTPIKHLLISVAPGITIGHEAFVYFSTHFEVIYEFEIGFMHLGPMVDYGFDKEDSHISFGLHAGFGF